MKHFSCGAVGARRLATPAHLFSAVYEFQVLFFAVAQVRAHSGAVIFNSSWLVWRKVGRRPCNVELNESRPSLVGPSGPYQVRILCLTLIRRSSHF